MPISALFVAGAALPLRAGRDRPRTGAPVRRARRLRRAHPARMDAGQAEQAEADAERRFLPEPPVPTTPMDPTLGAQTAVIAASDAPAAAPSKAAAAHADWLSSLLGAAPQALDADHPFAPAAAAAAVRQDPPTRRVEEWRFTDLRAVFGARFVAAAGDPEAAAALGARQYVVDGAAAALVFVDGRFCRESSSFSDDKCRELEAAGGYVGGLDAYPGDKLQIAALFARDELSGARSDKGANGLFAALNVALARDAAVVDIPADCSVRGPVVVLFAGSGGAVPERTRASAPRLAVRAGRGAVVDVLESHLTLVPETCWHGLALGCAAVVAEEGAKVRHYYMNMVACEAAVLAASYAEVNKGASYEMVSVSVGGKVARQSVWIELMGEEAHGGLKGAAVANGYRVADLHSRIVHDAENTTSEQLQKNIASDHGRTVFSGRIIVTKNADMTDSSQLCRSLLLSEKAQVDAMPVLEIATDDVKCTHGATVTDLQPEELFYCQSRGLSSLQARTMLIAGFVKEVLTECPVPMLKNIVEPIIEEVSNEYQQTKQREVEYSSI